MPYSISKPPKRIKKLPRHAQEIWIAAYNNAYKNYDPKKSKAENREAYANSVAWGAVNEKYKKNEKGKWVAKSLLMVATVVRTVIENGQRRFMFTGSSDRVDLMGERLDPSIFDDFVYNFERGYPGPIHVDIAHLSYYYPALKSLAYTGEVDKLYRDGRYIKGWAFEYDNNPFSEASWEMLKRSAEGKLDYVISCSLGFMPDFGNIGYENGVFTYRGGRNEAYIEHLAKTAYPANLDAEITLEEVAMATKSKEGPTPLDDAQNVLGDEQLVEQLEEARKKAGVSRAATSEGLVIKAEDDEQHDDDEEELGEDDDNEEGDDETEEPEDEETEDDEEEEEEPEEVEIRAATEAEKKAQKARSKKYKIQILSKGSNVTIPKKYADMGASFADMADPVNCKYPVWLTKSKASLSEAQLKQVRNAPARWEQNKGVYNSSSASKVQARINKALKKFKVGEYREKAATKTELIEIAAAPYGGATSIQEATDYIEASEAETKAWMDWYLFKGVVENILESVEIEDKSAAVSDAIDDFKDLLTTKSLLVIPAEEQPVVEEQPATGEQPEVVETPEAKATTETPEAEEAPPAEAPAQPAPVPTPEEQGVRVAKSWSEAVEAILTSGAPMQMKRAAIGESLVNAASAMESVLQPTPAAAPQTPAQPIDVQIIVKAIEEGFGKITDALQAQQAQMPQEKRQLPQRKSMVPTASAIVTKGQSFGEIVDRLLGAIA